MATPFARFVPDSGTHVSTSVWRCAALGVLPAHLDLTAAAFHAAPAPAPVLAAVVKQPAAPVGNFTELDAPRIARGQQFDSRTSHGPEQEIEALLIRPPLPREAVIRRHQSCARHRVRIGEPQVLQIGWIRSLPGRNGEEEA